MNGTFKTVARVALVLAAGAGGQSIAGVSGAWEQMMAEAVCAHAEGNWAVMDQMLTRAEEAAALFPPSDIRRVATLNNRAEYYKAKEEYDKTEECYRKGLELLESASERGGVHRAMICNNIGYLRVLQNKPAEAADSFEQAAALFQRELGTDCKELIQVLDALADVYFAQEAYPKAREAAEKHLALAEKHLNKNSIRLPPALNRLGLICWALNDPNAGDVFFARALEVQKAYWGANHLKYAEALAQRAAGYHLVKEVERAEPLYREALACLDAATEPCWENVAKIAASLGELLEAEKRYDESIQSFERAAAAGGKTGDPALLASLYESYAKALLSAGRTSDAQRKQEQAQRYAEQVK